MFEFFTKPPKTKSLILSSIGMGLCFVFKIRPMGVLVLEMASWIRQ